MLGWSVAEKMIDTMIAINLWERIDHAVHPVPMHVELTIPRLQPKALQFAVHDNELVHAPTLRLEHHNNDIGNTEGF
jgi:hypothetical protein